MIFQEHRNNIAKEPYSFVNFKGAGGGVRTLCQPSGSAHGNILNEFDAAGMEKIDDEYHL